VGYTRAAGVYDRSFVRGEMDTVGEDGHGCEEFVGIVNGGIAFMLGEELTDEGELGLVLGNVRLDGEVRFLVQTT